MPSAISKTQRKWRGFSKTCPRHSTRRSAFSKGSTFSLDELQFDYPDEICAGYATEQEALEAFVRQGAAKRYPEGVPKKIEQAIAKELDFVASKKYPAYFLTVYDIVRFAREKGILAQGRGSAANSVLCYCLGITEVDPNIHDLLFERFVSDARNEPPDIDVDFEHERREEVIQYIYAKYGRERAGLAASVVTYRARSAIREVGKVFGLSEDMVSALSGTVWGWWSGTIDDVETKRLGFDPREPRLAQAIALAGELAGFPRHLSQHTGGFVITRTRLDEVVPIANAAMEDRTTVEWDKDDLDALKILKIDVLGLGMLTVLRKGFELLQRHYGLDLTLATIPREEACVYAMIQRADTIGVFQIESRAQMSMLPRLKPKEFYDLVIEVAIVRPGPIQGDMVHPYLRRREGKEPVVYPSKELEDVLGKTLGVPLFQEQAMRIAIVAAGFTPAEADELRRAMATFKRAGTIGKLQDENGRGNGQARLSARICGALFQADRGLRHVWLSGKPCVVIRQSRLCLGLDEMPLSRRVRRRDAQFTADGLLRPRAACARRARSRHRNARDRHQRIRMGSPAGAVCGWRFDAASCIRATHPCKTTSARFMRCVSASVRSKASSRPTWSFW